MEQSGRLVTMKKLGRVLKRFALGLCVAFILIQFIPVNRTNPPVESDVGAPPDVGSVLRRACYDCHSNETTWPWYSHVAPVSWVIAHDVQEGRAALNFSAWNRLSPNKRAEAIRESWQEVAQGKMPTWYYIVLHPEARLSANDQSTLRAWSGSTAGGEKSEVHGD
jgi:hypothetical protein